MELNHAAHHFASAHNRDSLNAAVRQLPLVIAAPQSLADEANRERDQYSARAESEALEAESAWASRMRWKWVRRMLMGLAAGSFLFGALYPLYLIERKIPFVPHPLNAKAKP